MIRHNMEQRTIEWHEIKHSKIGGTLSKGLFVKSDTLLIDLLSQCIEEYEGEESYISSDMQRGIDLEPYAREALANEVFVSFKEVGFLQSDSIPLLGLSPDGITDDDTAACEIKCPSAKKHTSTILANEIPSDNIHQCLHYFTVNPKLEILYFASYRPECLVKPLWWTAITLFTPIDLGTKAKPNIKTVEEWVGIAREEAEKLNHELNMALLKLNEMYGN
jgi:hypothetical protein